MPHNAPFRMWIANILKAKYFNSEAEFEPSYILFNDVKITKLDLMGTVVDNYKSPNSTFSSITIDDGSATISVRCFKERVNFFDNIKMGNVALVIGRPREYQGQMYLVLDSVKIFDDPNWDVLRKIELLKSFGKPKYESFLDNEMPAGQELEDGSADGSTKNKVMILIDSYGDNGTDIESINKDLALPEEELITVLKDLSKDGLIFQAKPGTYKRI